MRRGFYLSITAVIVLLVVVGFVMSANRTASFERELRIEADRAHTMSTSLLRLRSSEIPNAVALALKESIVEADGSLSTGLLESLSRSGSYGAYYIEHPIEDLEQRGSEIANEHVEIRIISFDVMAIEPGPSAFDVRVTYDLRLSIASEFVEGNFTYDDARAIVSIVGANHPDGGTITKSDYRSESGEPCYLRRIGFLTSDSECYGQPGIVSMS